MIELDDDSKSLLYYCLVCQAAQIDCFNLACGCNLCRLEVHAKMTSKKQQIWIDRIIDSSIPEFCARLTATSLVIYLGIKLIIWIVAR